MTDEKAPIISKWEFIAAGNEISSEDLARSALSGDLFVQNNPETHDAFLKKIKQTMLTDRCVKTSLDIVQITDCGRAEHQQQQRERAITQLTKRCVCTWRPGGDLCVFLMHPKPIAGVTKQSFAVAFHVDSLLWVIWTWPASPLVQTEHHVVLAHTFREICAPRQGVEMRMVVDMFHPVIWNGCRLSLCA